MTRVRLPRLLDANFNEVGRAQPTALQISLQLRDASTAQMTVPGGGIGMHAWTELYTHKGSAGLFRVTGITRDLDGADTLTLRHAIDTLSDSVWRAQTDYDGTVAGFLSALLGQQTRAYWQLGVCEDTAAYKRSGINYNRLSELLREMMEARDGFYPDYDLTTTPWTLNFRALPQAVSAEARMGRNTDTAQITRDDGDLCNRLHLSINTMVTTDGVTTNQVEIRTYNDAASQAVYGVIEKTADIDTADVGDPDAWAAAFLARRKAPAVQITIDGYELSRLTGDSWDEFGRGRMVRVNLRGIGETVDERVEAVNYPDALGEPEHVTVELANRLARFTSTIAQLERETARAGGAARSAARSAASGAELEHWAMVVSQHTEALDATGITELWETGIILDAQTGAKIYSLNQGFQSQYAELQVQSGQISTLVQETGVEQLETGTTLYSKITQNAGNITTLVQQTGVGSLSAGETLYSMISQNATEITTKVSAGDVASTINQTAQSVLIQASKIDLQGYVTVSELDATDARIDNLINGQMYANSLGATEMSTESMCVDNAFSFGGMWAAWWRVTLMKSDGTPVTKTFMIAH